MKKTQAGKWEWGAGVWPAEEREAASEHGNAPRACSAGGDPVRQHPERNTTDRHHQRAVLSQTTFRFAVRVKMAFLQMERSVSGVPAPGEERPRPPAWPRPQRVDWMVTPVRVRIYY